MAASNRKETSLDMVTGFTRVELDSLEEASHLCIVVREWMGCAISIIGIIIIISIVIGTVIRRTLRRLQQRNELRKAGVAAPNDAGEWQRRASLPTHTREPCTLRDCE